MLKVIKTINHKQSPADAPHISDLQQVNECRRALKKTAMKPIHLTAMVGGVPIILCRIHSDYQDDYAGWETTTDPENATCQNCHRTELFEIYKKTKEERKP